MPDECTIDPSVVEEWMAARNVAVAFLRELCPHQTQSQLEHNAAALFARLASHKPPILLQMQSEENFPP